VRRWVIGEAMAYTGQPGSCVQAYMIPATDRPFKPSARPLLEAAEVPASVCVYTLLTCATHNLHAWVRCCRSHPRGARPSSPASARNGAPRWGCSGTGRAPCGDRHKCAERQMRCGALWRAADDSRSRSRLSIPTVRLLNRPPDGDVSGTTPRPSRSGAWPTPPQRRPRNGRSCPAPAHPRTLGRWRRPQPQG